MISFFQPSSWKRSPPWDSTIMISTLQKISRSDLQRFLCISHCRVFHFLSPLSELSEFIAEQRTDWFYFCRSTYWNVWPFYVTTGGHGHASSANISFNYPQIWIKEEQLTPALFLRLWLWGKCILSEESLYCLTKVEDLTTDIWDNVWPFFSGPATECRRATEWASSLFFGDVKSQPLYTMPPGCLCNSPEICLCVKKAAETVALRWVSCHLWPPSSSTQTIFLSQTDRHHTDSWGLSL